MNFGLSMCCDVILAWYSFISQLPIRQFTFIAGMLSYSSFSQLPIRQFTTIIRRDGWRLFSQLPIRQFTANCPAAVDM